MRPLLSTRLISTPCCGAGILRKVRSAGFPSLELRSDSLAHDLLRPGEAERLTRELAAEGTRAATLQIGPAVTGKLGDPSSMLRLRDALAWLRPDVVTIGPPRNLDVNELLAQAELSGARLCIEQGSFSAAEIRAWPPAVDLGWDLAAASTARPGDLDRFLGAIPAGRLLMVRVSSRDGAGRRIPPGEREAIVLDQVWQRLQPVYAIYDVDDPSGFCAGTCLDDVLAGLRAFHAGELLPHATRPWGQHGASLAPG